MRPRRRPRVFFVFVAFFNYLCRPGARATTACVGPSAVIVRRRGRVGRCGGAIDGRRRPRAAGPRRRRSVLHRRRGGLCGGGSSSGGGSGDGLLLIVILHLLLRLRHRCRLQPHGIEVR